MQSETKEAVLSAIADDYENLESVLRYLQNIEKTTANVGHVTEALGELVANGFAQTYELSSRPPHAKCVDFDSSRIGELWFYATPEGKRLLKSRPSSP